VLDDGTRNARKNHHTSNICVGGVSTDFVQSGNKT
jgi:hypothetical protein